MAKTYLIFFGPPGSGKGTQVNKLAEILKLQVICPGKILRHEIEIGSDLGKKVESIVDSGRLVPSKIIEKLIDNYLSSQKAKKGVIFDGYPRNKEQLDHLIKRFKEIVSKDDKIFAILIDVSSQEVIQRLGGRRVCDCGAAYHLKFKPPKRPGICDECGKKLYVRDDDKPEVIKDRLTLYHKQTKILFDYFTRGNILIKINGEQKIEDVHQDIIKELRRRGIK